MGDIKDSVRKAIPFSTATRFITVASPSKTTDDEHRDSDPDYVTPPPVYEDYALLKVLFSLRMANKKRYPVHSFSYEELSVTQIFSGYQFSLQHGRQTQVSSATIGKYQVTKEGWSIVTTDDLTQQPVRKPASYSEAVELLRQLQQQEPAKAAEVTIIRQSELKNV